MACASFVSTLLWVDNKWSWLWLALLAAVVFLMYMWFRPFPTVDGRDLGLQQPVPA
jgi:hypothetical protein